MKYTMFSHRTVIDEQPTITYGLIAVDGKKIKIIKDVTTDKETFEKLVKDMNENQIEFEHIYDVFEDYLW